MSVLRLGYLFRTLPIIEITLLSLILIDDKCYSMQMDKYNCKLNHSESCNRCKIKQKKIIHLYIKYYLIDNYNLLKVNFSKLNFIDLFTFLFKNIIFSISYGTYAILFISSAISTLQDCYG